MTKFSTEFIYGYRPDGYYVGSGMYIREALKTINKVGDCYQSDCPGNHEYETAMKNVESKIDTLKDKAHPHRISSYIRLNNISDIKSALMDYGYVVVEYFESKDLTVECEINKIYKNILLSLNNILEQNKKVNDYLEIAKSSGVNAIVVVKPGAFS